MTSGRSVVFSGYSGFSTKKTDYHDITEILLKVALNTITLPEVIDNFITYCSIKYTSP
jgi:hypothetical protein